MFKNYILLGGRQVVYNRISQEKTLTKFLSKFTAEPMRGIFKPVGDI